MKSYTRLLSPFLCLTILTLSVVVGCSGSKSIPKPEFSTPGTGAALGQVMFPDGTPVAGNIVYIFKAEETRSFATCEVNKAGYFVFNNLPVGLYDIYTAPKSSTSRYGETFFMGSPAATITVSEYETTVVPTITVPMDIEITLDNPRIAGMLGKPETSRNIIDGHNPKFTWTDVKNAAYYDVEVWSTYTEKHPSNKDYDETRRVVNNLIVWPTNLSSLPYQEFRIDVEASRSDGVLLASGYQLFTIDNPPEGWALK